MKVYVESLGWGEFTLDVNKPDIKPEHPKFNSAAFFEYLRSNLFYGSLSQQQVDGINHLGRYLLEAPFDPDVAIEQQAYCLATFQWETASTMQPIAEYGGPSTRYTPWYGRGYVQLTWEENYEKQENKLKLLSMDDIPWEVHQNRELAMNPDTSAIISIYGMIDGDFTGKSLSDYVKPNNVDYHNARRIVNGTDHAADIATMAKKYEKAVRRGYN